MFEPPVLSPEQEEVKDERDMLFHKWVESGDADKERDAFLAFMETDEYARLPYNVRNSGFITSSKIQTYAHNPYEAKLEFEDGIFLPWQDKECMLIGRALDDLKTRGMKFFEESYVIVDRRTTAGKEKAEWASKHGINCIGKSALTKIHRASAHFDEHPLFPKELNKTNLIWLWGGKIPCKAELDHYEPEKLIVDLKYVGSLERFYAMRYQWQMAFYFAAILERYMLKLPARLCVVDQNGSGDSLDAGFARAHAWEFQVNTLDGAQPRISQLVHAYADSVATGVFPDNGEAEGNIDILKEYWKSDYYPLLPHKFSSKPTII